jgi:hypothetical protein
VVEATTSSPTPSGASIAVDAHPLCAAWAGIWAAHPADIGAHWSSAHCTFVPYDSTAIVDGRIAIVTYLAQRYTRTRLVSTRWRLAAIWSEGETQVVATELEMTTSPPHGAPLETRVLRFLAAGAVEDGAWRLRHVSEAMPAVLVEAIGGYEREAREAKANASAMEKPR